MLISGRDGLSKLFSPKIKIEKERQSKVLDNSR